MEYIFGIVLASITMSIANRVRDRNRDLFFAVILILIGFAYVGFASYPKSLPNLKIEILVALGFFVIAVAGYCKRLWLIVAGLAMHAIYSVYHSHLFPIAYLPTWWQPFSYAYDITLAFWLAALAAGREADRRSTTESGR